MKKKPLSDLSDLQKNIMEIIWKLGEASGRQVQKQLRQKKSLAYTTVCTLLKRLETAGWLKHRSEGRTFFYQAAQSREKEAGRSSRNLIQRVFHGNTRLLVQHLIEEENLSDVDLREIKKMIDKKRKELKS